MTIKCTLRFQQGKEDKFKENLKMMKEHLICQSWPKEKTESSILSSTVNTTTNVVGVSSPVTMVQSSTFSPKKEISSTFPTTLNTNNFTHYNISTSEFLIFRFIKFLNNLRFFFNFFFSP